MIQDVTAYHTDWDKQQVMNALKDEPLQENPLNAQLSNMILRAQFNIQRDYEIYIFTATDDIQEDSVYEWSERDPQSLVNWIRVNGSPIYSKVNTAKKVIV